MNLITKLYPFIILLGWPFLVAGQSSIRGQILSRDQQVGIAGASIRVDATGVEYKSAENGDFTISVGRDTSVVQISCMGYKPKTVMIARSDKFVVIELDPEVRQIDEVHVSTGYQSLAKERSPGSFEFISNELLNRAIGTDIVSRLEGVASGLTFDRRMEDIPVSQPSSLTSQGKTTNITIRGFSTIEADIAPLVVLDNFPYEGDLSNINPNDVENITILKDAAAASIWGARAGNGVIVITTKKGKYNRKPTVSLTSNLSMVPKPDLFYNPNYLASPDFIDVETKLYSMGYYNTAPANLNALSPVVELLAQADAGNVSQNELKHQLDRWKQKDVRKDFEKYSYRNAVNQQYALNFSGGAENLNYHISSGYDRNASNLIGNGSQRVTLRAINSFKPVKRLEITTEVAFVQNQYTNNGLPMESVVPVLAKQLYPYAELAGADGGPLAMTKTYRPFVVENAESDGLLNWDYKPLEERDLTDYTTRENEMRVSAGLGYKIAEGLDIVLKYQYQRINGQIRNMYDKESYYIRNLVNTYTQDDGTQIYPYGSELRLTNIAQTAHAIRGQANYEKVWGRHRLHAIGGVDVRQLKKAREGNQFYGYDEAVLTYVQRLDFETRYVTRPRGTQSQLPIPAGGMSEFLDRFISQYANAAYTLNEKYTVSGSVRRDASNLFGVSTNQKGTPLWSVGALWDFSKERFYNVVALPNLKIRASYGQSGNIDKSVSTYITASYSNNSTTGLRQAAITNAGNPSLKWEKVSQLNLGVDFSAKNQRISGSVEFYRKTSSDLLGDVAIDPTIGFYRGSNAVMRINYANMQSSGWDIKLSSRNLTGILSWNSDLLVNFNRDKITNFRYPTTSLSAYFTTYSPPLEGKPRYSLYSFPWEGLDPQTGNPLVLVDQEVSTDYNAYTNALSTDDLIYHGPQNPPLFGSLRNTFNYKRFAFSFNLIFKMGYYFRRNSIDYSGLFGAWAGHIDYAARWQMPGDELNTQVPSFPTEISTVLNRSLVFLRSPYLVEKGDHIRLQDVNLSYQLDHLPRLLNGGTVRANFYASNLGILWMSNGSHLDPDRPTTKIIPKANYSLGLQVTF